MPATLRPGSLRFLFLDLCSPGFPSCAFFTRALGIYILPYQASTTGCAISGHVIRPLEGFTAPFGVRQLSETKPSSWHPQVVLPMPASNRHYLTPGRYSPGAPRMCFGPLAICYLCLQRGLDTLVLPPSWLQSYCNSFPRSLFRGVVAL
jgi:hypothetical protein